MELLYLLSGFGFLCVVAILIAFISALCGCIKYKIVSAKWKYEYKHRFDKPPTAACYCKDCYKHDNGTCGKFDGLRTADNWFCWQAEPKKGRD